MSIPSNIGTANRTGTTARALLARGDWSGRVLAIVSEAAYLLGSDDAVLWLAQEKTPLHPRALRGAFDLRAVRAGMRFGQQDALVYFASSGGEQLPEASLHWADASVWQPPIIPTAQVATPGAVPARMLELLAALPSPVGDDTLGQLLPLLRQMATGGNPTAAASSSPFVSAATTPFIETARACRERDMLRLIDAARALIGLGPGLTPGGDDFVGGLLFVAHHLNAAYPGELHWDAPRLVDWLAWARPQTNPISYAILSDHAHGQGVQPLHELVAALLSNKPLDESMPSVRATLAIGNTTGWDMLTGALTAMLLMAGKD
jgi:hypothetical protein